jgi:TolA-binding protein
MFVAEQPSPPVLFGASFSLQSHTASSDGRTGYQPNSDSYVQLRSTSNTSNNSELNSRLVQLEAKVELLSNQSRSCRCQHLEQKVDILEEQTKAMEAKLQLLDLKLSQLNLGQPATNLMNMSTPMQNNASSSASINSSSGYSLANPETPPDIMLTEGSLAGNTSMGYGSGCYNARPWFDPLFNDYPNVSFQLPQMIPMNVPLGPIDGGFGNARQCGTGGWFDSQQEDGIRVR